MYEPVDRGPDELELGEPIRAAGRSPHEATAVDQRRRIVYETEDLARLGAGFYRYILDDPRQLTAGGRLRCRGPRRPQLDMREDQEPGRPLLVEWVDIDEPDPPQTAFADPPRTFEQATPRAARCSTDSRAAGRSAGRSSSSPPAAATPRTAT